MHKQDIELRDLRVEISAKEMEAKELLYSIKRNKSSVIIVLSFLILFLFGLIICIDSAYRLGLLFIIGIVFPLVAILFVDKLIIQKEIEYDEVREQIKKLRKRKDKLEIKINKTKYHSTHRAPRLKIKQNILGYNTIDIQINQKVNEMDKLKCAIKNSKAWIDLSIAIFSPIEISVIFGTKLNLSCKLVLSVIFCVLLFIYVWKFHNKIMHAEKKLDKIQDEIFDLKLNKIMFELNEQHNYTINKIDNLTTIVETMSDMKSNNTIQLIVK